MKRHDIALGDDRSLHLVDAGEGPPVVLIHGALVTSQDWVEGPLRALASGRRVLAPDRPGHGRSERPRFAASPDAQAEQMRGGLALLDIRRPLLVAHSFGGLVALAWAAAHPDEVAGLVLVAPIAFPEFRPMEQTLYGPRAMPVAGPLLSAAASPVDPPILRRLQEIMFKPGTPPERWLETFPYGEVLSSANLVREGEDAAAVLPGSPMGFVDLRRIDLPVTILSGDRDLVVDPFRHARPLAGKLPRAELVMVPGAGHMLHHTHPDRLVDAVSAMAART